MTTKYIPDRYHSITPSLCVDGAQKLIDFLTDVFGAKERMRMEGPGGKIMHAEFNIGDSAIMLMFYGDRSAAVTDPFGNFWAIATHIEDVSPAELKKRAEAFQKQFAAS